MLCGVPQNCPIRGFTVSLRHVHMHQAESIAETASFKNRGRYVPKGGAQRVALAGNAKDGKHKIKPWGVRTSDAQNVLPRRAISEIRGCGRGSLAGKGHLAETSQLLGETRKADHLTLSVGAATQTNLLHRRALAHTSPAS